MHILGSIFSILFALGLAFFALLNLNSVDITWSPFHEKASLPLYLICSIAATFGFFMGSVVTWLYGGKTRKTKRDQKRKIKDLEKKMGKIRNDIANDKTPFMPSSGLLSIGKK